MSPTFASIIVPTYNGAQKIVRCLDALSAQLSDKCFEIIVVDDGSTDATLPILEGRSRVQVISQTNSGPAAARNRGARAATGEIILFTDDDCEPTPCWLDTMLLPFADPNLVGAKGVYRTRQTSLAARFVQMEYEDKYRFMAEQGSIDFIDTYSAAFRRSKFLQLGGYDTSFPVACAEDVELSFRMSARGWLMRFVPEAQVFHTHPDTFSAYLRKKYKFAFWRIYAVEKNPSKGVKDSHTPQTMKLQLLLWPALFCAAIVDLIFHLHVSCSLVVMTAFLLSTLPFSFRTARKDFIVGLIAPLALAARSGAQLFGVVCGALYTWRRRSLADSIA